MKSNTPWIPIAKIQELIQLEPAFILAALAIIGWLIYKLFLKRASQERHRTLTRLFRNLSAHLVAGTSAFLIYYGLTAFYPQTPAIERLASYFGFITLLWGSVIFVKTARIYVFEYLFLSHMRVAVPLLLVNLFTLVLSLVLVGWLATEVFSIRVIPVLATSAIVSLVLGLALQDTLGNLFAGVALQFDKPYEIGDWIEIQNGSQKWVGQVSEISWRATVLLAFGEESITVSNRVMAQSEIANFSAKSRPFIRSHVFRVPYRTDLARTKEILMLATLATVGVRKDPLPLVLVTELTESWISVKVIYYIDSYVNQYIIGDKIITAALEALNRAGIEIASTRITVHQPEELPTAIRATASKASPIAE